jgi:hypothetical protein
MRSLYSTMKYLINKDKAFDLAKYFRETGVVDKEQGESIFKEAIEKLVNLPLRYLFKS